MAARHQRQDRRNSQRSARHRRHQDVWRPALHEAAGTGIGDPMASGLGFVVRHVSDGPGDRLDRHRSRHRGERLPALRARHSPLGPAGGQGASRRHTARRRGTVRRRPRRRVVADRARAATSGKRQLPPQPGPAQQLRQHLRASAAAATPCTTCAPPPGATPRWSAPPRCRLSSRCAGARFPAAYRGVRFAVGTVPGSAPLPACFGVR